MATLTQMQGRLKGVIRNVRAVYRIADTAGERLERELDRLMGRTRLIQPNDLLRAAALYNSYDKAVGNIANALTAATTILSAPILP